MHPRPSFHIDRGPTPRFSHVVFADASIIRRRVVDTARYAVTPAPVQAPAVPNELHDRFLLWLLQQGGVDGSMYRIETLRRRLPACLRALHVRTPAAARRALQRNPTQLHAALSATLIGVTSFFRDAQVFDALERSVLPALAAARRRPLRIWSVGCSDGAELYSVAMLLAEAGLLDGASLLGTDCRADAVTAARSGRYTPLATNAVSAARLRRHFRTEDGAWRIDERLRRAATFRIGNVFACPEPGHWDVILCRNLAIYLDDGAARDLWRRLDATMRPGAVLVVGKAERPDHASLAPIGPSMYRRTVS